MDPRADDPTQFGERLHHWIGGEPVLRPAARIAPLPVRLQGAVGGGLPLANTEEVDEFLLRLGGALSQWLATPAPDRLAALCGFADAVEADTARLAAILVLERGITADAAAAQVERSLRATREILAEGEAARSPDVAPGINALVLSRHRAGKVLLAAVTRVLLSDAIVVIKPSESTPLSMQRFAEIAADCGLQAGVINVVQGDEETTDALVSNPHVAGILFDGSPDSTEHVERLARLCRKPVVFYAEGPSFAGSLQTDDR